MEQQIVKIEPLRAVGWPGNMAGERTVTVDGLGVVLVIRAVELARCGADEGRIEMIHRIVRLDQRQRGGGRFWASRRLPALKVRMDRAPGLLELADWPTGDVLHDRPQVPARPAAGRTVRCRLRAPVPRPA